MSATTAATPPIPVRRPARRRPPTRQAHFLALGAVAVVATAVLTVESPQLGAGAALLGLVATAYVGHPPAGLGALWALWFVAPGLRRVLGLETGYVDADPLAVVPFAATAVVAILTMLSIELPRRVWLVLVAGGLGLTLGVLTGLGTPSAAAFAGFAYASALSAVVIGFREGRGSPRRWSLTRAIAVGAPLLALYALYQYFVGLPLWDELWLQRVDFASVGAPEEGKTRAFSTLNAPGALAAVLAVGLLLLLARQRLGVLSLAPMALLTMVLVLTYVRSAWVALVAGLLVLLLITRGRAAPHIVGFVVVLAVVGLALGASGPTLDAFLQRTATFGALEADVSANARQEQSRALLPEVFSAPAGHGLGSAGEATRLGAEGVRALDNGYLSLAYQLGVPGALLLFWGVALAAWLSARRAWTRPEDHTAAVLTASFALFFVLLAAGDAFYGLPGVILWYLTGAALARAEPTSDGGPSAAHGYPVVHRGPAAAYSTVQGSSRHPSAMSLPPP